MSCVNSCGFLNYKCWLLGKELCRDETLAIVANPYQKLYKDNRKDENVGKNLWNEVVERVKVEWPNAKENQYGKMRIDKS